ncbi:MAG: NAD-dependent malic enzyme [Gammaproteobacteria bacterium HGW-Gammaproteobacteria-3]|nr:MAG: NAD-dependent malic enzyme [Gammaproteobacteria bacterium HGW-Gammaproteobacteria-3]
MTDATQPTQLTGLALLKNPQHNKSTAFTEEERDRYKLRGLLPAAVSTQAIQVERVLANLRRKAYDIERYIFLMALQGRNERLFYRVLIDHIDEVLPIVYTPTVGQACQEFAHIFRQPRGFYITPGDLGRIGEILKNWPEHDVRMIVVTDGERILGLGDLGANGMGIPIGKLALYTACAGIAPHQCLPVMLDVGTNNESLRNDPLYLGLKQARITGAAYLALVDEFVETVQKAYPRALIQFEDFLTPNAYALLKRYRDRVLCFNDDIQGTAAVALAGVLASCRLLDTKLDELRIMFLGAGSAATGIADLLQSALIKTGLSQQEARHRLWFVDIAGLVVKSRQDLAPHNQPYAHDLPPSSFVDALKSVKPQVLIGATGAPGLFDEEIIRLMAQINEKPVIFALSNPTSRAECTAEQAYRWSDGRAVFASGSPFAPVEYQGRTLRPGQGNNAYIFPGIGLGALACNARQISDEMFLEAARVLADNVSAEDLTAGTLYPPLAKIRQVSLEIAVAVAAIAYGQNLARAPRPHDLARMIKAMMYDPGY